MSFRYQQSWPKPRRIVAKVKQSLLFPRVGFSDEHDAESVCGALLQQARQPSNQAGDTLAAFCRCARRRCWVNYVCQHEADCRSRCRNFLLH